MKKSIKILLGFSPLILIFAFALGVIANGTCLRIYKKPKDLTGESWMKNIDGEQYLKDIKIPGSHDSGTYKMNWLGNTQNESIAQQLNDGCRYFDIRVKKIAEDNYKIYHGPITGVKFDPIIDDIKTFISTHTTETLILDFQHFENDSQEYVFNKIKDNLLNYVVKNETELDDPHFVDQLKLKDTRGKCLILFGYGAYSEENFIFKRNGDGCSNNDCCLDSYYDSDLNSVSSKRFINETIPTYINKMNEKQHLGLKVLQGQLTDGKLIFGPFSREKLHEKNMKKYVLNLKNESYFSDINIVMRDFVNSEKMADIYNLNF